MLLCLCLWGAAACLQTTDSGLRGEEIIRLHREGAAALAGETVDQDMLDQFRPAYEKMVFAGDARELMGCIDLYEFLGHVLDTAASAEILAVDQQMPVSYTHLNVRHDLGHRVGHGQENGGLGHGLHHLPGDQARPGDADEDISAHRCV